MEIDQKVYSEIKVKEVTGRYVTNHEVFNFFDKLDASFQIMEIGTSVQQRSIKSITFGTGQQRVLMWSQMHGNESTTTKAVLDFISLIFQKREDVASILNACTFTIIPILNSDGAAAYTRVNANKVDLNRDAQERSQPESKILRAVYNSFTPHYCFNLHDQRTIFNVGSTNKPATVSFLAPAFDEARNISPSRKKSMLLIAAMNKSLQSQIPGQVGRYDDAFNANCVGDAFQMLETPTVLFEAGHFKDDYEREITRAYIFQAMLSGVRTIAHGEINLYEIAEYQNIPENSKQFFDVIVENASVVNSKYKESEPIGILYKEVLKECAIHFKPTVEKIGFENETYFAHKQMDCHKQTDLDWLAKRGILALLK
ncbi:M14 metallopeptidase family protein [Maribacter sp. 2210JD10-5]|uniref:M14 family metallopeptidase n=1 Tax=Maribacter sp. 2210JD10-5 TaxID=3386272 RepID=UPI0039BD7511